MGNKIWARACIFLSCPTTPAAGVSTEAKPNLPLRTQLRSAYGHRTPCSVARLAPTFPGFPVRTHHVLAAAAVLQGHVTQPSTRVELMGGSLPYTTLNGDVQIEL
jgi:hypothetical protein